MIFVRLILLLLFFTISEYASAQKVWDAGSSRLVFDDFRAAPIYSSDGSGMSAVNIVCDYSIYDDMVWFNLVAVFHEDSSWLKSNNALVLKHEQLHFDIAEYVARIARKNITKDIFLVGDIKSYMDSIHNIHNKLQSLYDAQTKHGRIKAKQIEWEKNIAAKLDSLQNFTLSTGIFER